MKPEVSGRSRLLPLKFAAILKARFGGLSF
jgi:hypothetical protein